MKKTLFLSCLLFFLFSFSACSALIETSVTQIRPMPLDTITTQDAGEFITIHHQDELTSAIWNMINQHTESQRFRIHHLQAGGGVALANNAVQETMTKPLAAFAVTTIIPHILAESNALTEIELSIVYAREATEIASVLPVHDSSVLTLLLQQALRRGDTFLAINATHNIANISFLHSSIYDLFHSPGFDVIAFPEVDIHLYPGFASGNQRIAEIQLDFGISPEEIFEMRIHLQEAADALIEEMPAELSPEAQIMWLANTLRSRTQLVRHDIEEETEDEPPSTYNTAYHALVHGIASPRGIAMAMHGLLTLLEIESYLILGTLQDENHAWNLAKIDDYFFHFDISALFYYSPQYALFLSDEVALFEHFYSWDMSRFPRAYSPLDYFYFHP